MKKLFKNKVIVLLFSMIIFSNCFSANEDKSGFLSNIRELKELSDIMDILNENYVGEKKIDKKILLQGAVKGMLESLDDPHSNYFTKSELESFKEDLKGTYRRYYCKRFINSFLYYHSNTYIRWTSF